MREKSLKTVEDGMSSRLEAGGKESRKVEEVGKEMREERKGPQHRLIDGPGGEGQWTEHRPLSSVSSLTIVSGFLFRHPIV